MATVSFTAAPPPIDTPLEEFGGQALKEGKPIRIRLQPDVYSPKDTNYKTWQGVVWIVEVPDLDEGRRLREGLTHFFKVFGSKRQARLLGQLRTLAGEPKG